MNKSFDPNRISFDGSVYKLKDIKFAVTNRDKYVVPFKFIDENAVQFLLSKDIIHKLNSTIKHIFCNNSENFLDWAETFGVYFVGQNNCMRGNIGTVFVLHKAIDLNSKNKIIKSLSEKLLELVSNCEEFNIVDFGNKLFEYSSDWTINEHDLYQLSIDLGNTISNNWSITYDKSDVWDDSPFSQEQDIKYLLKYYDSKTTNSLIKTPKFKKDK